MSTISASTTTTTAYKVTADTTGTLVLQTGATPTTALTIDASQNVTFAKPLQGASLSSITLGTAQNTTSGTAIDFTGIPSWVKRITVILNGVSENAGNNIGVQLGTSGGVETSGYTGFAVSSGAGGTAVTALSAGFDYRNAGGASSIMYGTFVIVSIGSSNTWVCTATGTGASIGYNTSGGKTLSGTLDRVRLYSAGTFDAGSVNIMYEG